MTILNSRVGKKVKRYTKKQYCYECGETCFPGLCECDKAQLDPIKYVRKLKREIETLHYRLRKAEMNQLDNSYQMQTRTPDGL